ncbi:MAG: cytochrome c oxidase assembly protein [Terriglobales bacterium]
MPHAHHASVASLWVSVALSLVAIVYLRQWLRVAWLDPDGVKGWRAWSFFVGLLLVWVALGSPLSLLDHDLLTVHMVQHLLLLTLAPPLILLGAPLKLLPRRSVQKQKLVELIAGPLLSTPMRQLGRLLLHPAISWIGATAALVVWHVPAVFALGLRSQTWHGVEQASFLVTGLLFWRPVAEPSPDTLKWPEPSILLYLFLATLPCDILAGFLVFCDRVVYPAYFFSSQTFGLSALEDQQCAGALMWTCVTLVYLIAGTIVTARSLSFDGSQGYAIRQSETQAVALRKSDMQKVEMI